MSGEKWGASDAIKAAFVRLEELMKRQRLNRQDIISWQPGREPQRAYLRNL